MHHLQIYTHLQLNDNIFYYLGLKKNIYILFSIINYSFDFWPLIPIPYSFNPIDPLLFGGSCYALHADPWLHNHSIKAKAVLEISQKSFSKQGGRITQAAIGLT